MIQKLDAWIGNSSSSGARLALPNSSMYGIPSYVMSICFLFNKTRSWIRLIGISFGRRR